MRRTFTGTGEALLTSADEPTGRLVVPDWLPADDTDEHVGSQGCSHARRLTPRRKVPGWRAAAGDSRISDPDQGIVGSMLHHLQYYVKPRLFSK